MKLLKQLTGLREDLKIEVRKTSESCDDEIDVEDTGYHSESDDRCTDSSGGSDGGL